MPRLSLYLYPQKAPAPTSPAATLLLLRDGVQGLEVLMTRRSSTASFAPGVFVFPGGKIDPQDQLDAQNPYLLDNDADLGQAITAAKVAAIRESFEELGIAFIEDKKRQYLSPEKIAQLQRDLPLTQQCLDNEWCFASSKVFHYLHWITDRDMPRRFDVPFFVAKMPPHQEPIADQAEQFEPQWVAPAQALKRHSAGDFLMIYPTIKTLEHLAKFSHTDAVFEAIAANQKPFFISSPRGGFLAGAEQRYMEHEPEFGELELTSPDGQLVHQLDWQSERPVALLKNIQRLTAPNPGFMTGPGTNTYLLGQASTGFIVVDPGPADERHLEKIITACDANIKAIICTHSHPDHSPGAFVLQKMLPQKVLIWGLASGEFSRADSRFMPDSEVQNGQVFELQDQYHQHSIQVIFTPGHASNHIALLLQEDAVLLSGDHILNGSTTVIDPPDGNMNDYLNSLDVLAALAEQGKIEFILPAHGYAIGNALQAIKGLKAHRLKREAKILQVVQANPKGTMDEWVAKAYDDVPERVWPIAKRSLLAHLQRLEQVG